MDGNLARKLDNQELERRLERSGQLDFDQQYRRRKDLGARRDGLTAQKAQLRLLSAHAHRKLRRTGAACGQRAGPEELQDNPRSRSAKLRWAERTGY